jgi:hypothetical protein
MRDACERIVVLSSCFVVSYLVLSCDGVVFLCGVFVLCVVLSGMLRCVLYCLVLPCVVL